MGYYEKAIASFDRSLELQPDAYWAWYNRGNALLKLGRCFEALNSFERAIEFKPDTVLAWHNRGITLSNCVVKRLLPASIEHWKSSRTITKPGSTGALT
jgi:tetratricopeptide (TPR) repeat protein